MEGLILPVYGIDFGYSEACIGIIDKDGNYINIPNVFEAKDTFDCVVYIENEAIVVSHYDTKFFSDEDDNNHVLMYPKKYLLSSEERIIDGESYSSEEICSYIFKHLRQIGEEQGYYVKDVVLAFPSYFGSSEKLKLIKSLKLAEMNIIGMVPEPLAIVLAYLFSEKHLIKNVLIYDLGSFTFDVSVVKICNDNILLDKDQRPTLRILSCGGDKTLGGEDWSSRLLDFVLNACCEENGIVPDDIDEETRQLIRYRVESTKKKLSNAESARINVNVNGSITKVVITREDFENMTSDLVERTMSYVEDTLTKINNIPIDKVIVTGGSVHMPMIKQNLEKLFPNKVEVFDPYHAVAMGAAIYGIMINNDSFEFPILKEEN